MFPNLTSDICVRAQVRPDLSAYTYAPCSPYIHTHIHPDLSSDTPSDASLRLAPPPSPLARLSPRP
eukprot:3861609-Rhodomonas_salina.1